MIVWFVYLLRRRNVQSHKRWDANNPGLSPVMLLIVHYILQSTPDHSPAEIVTLIKSVTAKRVFAEHPEVKKMLWGGEFWIDGYFVSSVGRFTSENVICEYIMNQGKEESYRQLYQNLPKGE